MSDRNSTPLPISGSASDSDGTANDDLTADLDLGFDGAEDILRVAPGHAAGSRPNRIGMPHVAPRFLMLSKRSSKFAIALYQE